MNFQLIYTIYIACVLVSVNPKPVNVSLSETPIESEIKMPVSLPEAEKIQDSGLSPMQVGIIKSSMPDFVTVVMPRQGKKQVQSPGGLEGQGIQMGKNTTMIDQAAPVISNESSTLMLSNASAQSEIIEKVEEQKPKVILINPNATMPEEESFKIQSEIKEQVPSHEPAETCIEVEENPQNPNQNTTEIQLKTQEPIQDQEAPKIQMANKGQLMLDEVAPETNATMTGRKVPKMNMMEINTLTSQGQEIRTVISPPDQVLPKNQGEVNIEMSARKAPQMQMDINNNTQILEQDAPMEMETNATIIEASTTLAEDFEPEIPVGENAPKTFNLFQLPFTIMRNIRERMDELQMIPYFQRSKGCYLFAPSDINGQSTLKNC